MNAKLDALPEAVGGALVDRAELPLHLIWRWIERHADDEIWWRFVDDIEAAIATEHNLRYNSDTRTYVPET